MATVRGEISSDLLVKNLPSQFTDKDKESLLQYFGANHVVCMGRRGRMRNSAYATFSDFTSAKQAMVRLHQLEVLNQRLVVEFAKTQHKELATKERTRLSPRPDGYHEGLPEENIVKDVKTDYGSDDNINVVSEKLGINYPRNPCLHYVYPPPTPSIITNIANALICSSNFYVQVLHLMNKLNLPAPFGFQTATPPFPGESSLKEKLSSSDESELESDSEDKTTTNVTCKRPSTGNKPKQKRLRIQTTQLLQPNQARPVSLSKAVAMQSMFEEAVGRPQQTNKIGVKLADTISAIFDATSQKQHHQDELNTGKNEGENLGFGMFAPPVTEKKDGSVEDVAEDETEDNTEFISLHELRRNRISRDEMKTLSVFKNYSCGEATCRLYVKNISKQVEVKDIRHVFGRFIDGENEESFDVRLMKEGRMKGQAFVTYANEKSAEKALKETNRYLLFGKPLVVQFARSAKPKT